METVEDEEYFRYYYTGVVTGIILNHLWTFFFVSCDGGGEISYNNFQNLFRPHHQMKEEEIFERSNRSNRYFVGLLVSGW
jgi:hypothetical protein